MNEQDSTPVGAMGRVQGPGNEFVSTDAPPPHAEIEIAVSSRPLAEDPSSIVPLLTLCWRALKRTADERERERREVASVIRHLEDSAGRIALELFNVRRLLDADNGPATCRAIGLAFETMDRILTGCGVRLIAPGGACYEGDLLETVRNVAQEQRSDIAKPVVLEVLTPAIVIHDRLFKAGQAVIGIPSPSSLPIAFEHPDPQPTPAATEGGPSSEGNPPQTI